MIKPDDGCIGCLIKNAKPLSLIDYTLFLIVLDILSTLQEINSNLFVHNYEILFQSKAFD